jgi:ribosomal protein S18 acetylase RimI-like enzyme
MVEIEWTHRVPLEVEKSMEQDWAKYDQAHGITLNYTPIALLLRHENGEIIGVLKAFTVFAEIYIDELWVHSSHRHKGLGRLLLQTLEARFTGKGFNNINLCTSAFQAPEFYKKCGFVVEFIRENVHHPKLTKYYLAKYFTETPQHQGTLS